MRNLERISVLLGLIDAMKERSWCGETHIQKAAYVLQEVADVDADMEFILYKHGPFSFDLRDELYSIHADGLVELVPRPAPYGPSWRVTEAGEKFLERMSAEVTNHTDAIGFVVDKLSGKGVAELERLATALYVTKKNADLSAADRASRIVELKSHVKLDDAKAAVTEIDEISEQYPANA